MLELVCVFLRYKHTHKGKKIMPKGVLFFYFFIVTVDRQVQLSIVKDFNKGFQKK